MIGKKGHWLAPKLYNNSKITKTIVAIDLGIKTNILRSLAELGCGVIVVPATTSFKEIMNFKPGGLFLSNGPGDPKATGKYIITSIKRELLKKQNYLFLEYVLGIKSWH